MAAAPAVLLHRATPVGGTHPHRAQVAARPQAVAVRLAQHPLDRPAVATPPAQAVVQPVAALAPLAMLHRARPAAGTLPTREVDLQLAAAERLVTPRLGRLPAEMEHPQAEAARLAAMGRADRPVRAPLQVGMPTRLAAARLVVTLGPVAMDLAMVAPLGVTTQGTVVRLAELAATPVGQSAAARMATLAQAASEATQIMPRMAEAPLGAARQVVTPQAAMPWVAMRWTPAATAGLGLPGRLMIQTSSALTTKASNLF